MQKHLNPNDGTPLYRQLIEVLRSSIQAGEYPPQSKIPTELELSEMFSISRITVRNAIDELVEDGILVRQQGKGTFVTPNKVRVLNASGFMGFSESCLRSGRVPSSKLLSYTTKPGSKKVLDFFGLPAGELIIRLQRLRLADDTPVMLETEYFPSTYDFLAKEPLEGSLHEILTKHGVFPAHFHNTISLARATPEEASILGIEPQSPLIFTYQEIKDSSGQPVEITKQLIHSDQYEIIVES